MLVRNDCLRSEIRLFHLMPCFGLGVSLCSSLTRLSKIWKRTQEPRYAPVNGGAQFGEMYPLLSVFCFQFDELSKRVGDMEWQGALCYTI